MARDEGIKCTSVTFRPPHPRISLFALECSTLHSILGRDGVIYLGQCNDGDVNCTRRGRSERRVIRTYIYIYMETDIAKNTT